MTTQNRLVLSGVVAGMLYGALARAVFGLDEHVTVGGRYFDVLQGVYEIEPQAPGKVILHLASTHRLSTRFNAYSGLWTDFIMRDVQEHILEIVKRRCEGGGGR
jgi:hypothetical protein